MKKSELATLAREWISLWCAPADLELFELLHADDFEDCSAAGREPTRKGFAEGLARFVEAFPDVQTTVEDLVIDEERSKVAIRWRARGTNRHNYLGIGPTNRQTTITGIEIIEVNDAKIIRRWGEWDISDHR